MKKTIFIFSLLTLIGFCAGCSKKTDPSKDTLSLPVTVDFTQITGPRKSDFTLNGVHFQSGGGNWRSGNCAVKTPAQPLAFYDGFIGLTGANIDYTKASSIVADLDGASIHKVTVRMYAKDAFDPVTMEPLPSAYVTLCNDGNEVAQITQMASEITESNGQIVQTWVLDAGGATAKRLIISSDDADLFSIAIE
jgi:hypothetical protein